MVINRINPVIRLLLLVIVTLLAPVARAVTISVTTDRDPAVQSESFVMIFESDGAVDDDPDFSPLNRDFQVLSTGESSNMSIINGRVSTTKSWTLNVIARRTGILTIPSIAFGSDKSTPATVNVVSDAPGSAARNDREIFMEVEANIDKPYVQSEVIYTVRLFRAIATANASLSDPPEVSGVAAVVEKIGEDRSYDTRRDGKLFGVVERRYAIYPQASGTLTVEPVIFQGEISRGLSFFNSPFGRQPRTVVVQSDALSLNVRPIPAAFSGGHWLPAREMTLMEEWSDYPLQFDVDEPLTRTLTLTAKGLTSSQLPELPAWRSADFKQYPDQPVLEDDKQGIGVIGKRVEKIAMIPGKAGTYTLPEISIPWWNTDTGKMEYATIPERRIEVIASGASSTGPLADIAPPPLGDLDLPGITVDPNLPAAGDDATETGTQDATGLPPDLWQWLSLALFLIWIITLILWRRAIRSRAGTTDEHDGKTALRNLARELKQACFDNDPRNCKEKLLAWGRAVWPDRPPASIGEIGNRCTEALAIEIRLLNNALYSRDGGHWQGRDLWLAFEQELKLREKKTALDKGQLEPLFKI